MKILLVGSGGREHALAWKIAQSPECETLLCAPGNPGIADTPRTRCVPVKADAVRDLADLAAREKVDLVACGPEAALCAGLGDAVRAGGIPFFGPSAAAAEIEGSKAWAKRLMRDAGVPTGAFDVFDDLPAAERFIDGNPAVVVKADGLAAGKGVVVARDAAEAKAAARRMLVDRDFGAAGARVVIEERLSGREVSMMALCDGERVTLLAPVEDHKAVRDGDQGPNTGGMGTYCPSPLVDETLATRVVDSIFRPTVAALVRAGRPFRGLLYAGLMLTRDRGPMVIEWNARFGDPETQSVLVRMEDDILPWLAAAARGGLPGRAIRFRPEAAVCVVLAAEGYPGAVRSGDEITGLPVPAGDLVVFHAGTRRDGDRLLTAGGRVLGVTALGTDLAAARARAYGAIGGIRFHGVHYRADIGTRGMS